MGADLDPQRHTEPNPPSQLTNNLSVAMGIVKTSQMPRELTEHALPWEKSWDQHSRG